MTVLGINRSEKQFDVDKWDADIVESLFIPDDNEEAAIIREAGKVAVVKPNHGYGMEEDVYLYTRAVGDESGTVTHHHLVAVEVEECGVIDLVTPAAFLCHYPNLPTWFVVRLYHHMHGR